MGKEVLFFSSLAGVIFFCFQIRIVFHSTGLPSYSHFVLIVSTVVVFYFQLDCNVGALLSVF